MSEDSPGSAREPKLDAAALEEVLRRAVELEQRNSESRADYSLDDAVRIAGEIGVGEEAVRGALVLVQREALMRPEQPSTRLDRWFGPARVITARNVRGPAREVRRIIGKVLSDQLFSVARNQKERVIWERSESFFDGVRRALNFDKSYKLSEVERIEVTVTDAALSDRVDVRIALDFDELRHSRIKRGVILPMVLAAPLLVASVSLGPAALGAWLMAGGATAGGVGIHMAMRRKYESTVRDSQEAVERLLDHLEHER